MGGQGGDGGQEEDGSVLVVLDNIKYEVEKKVLVEHSEFFRARLQFHGGHETGTIEIVLDVSFSYLYLGGKIKLHEFYTALYSPNRWLVD